MKAKIAHRSRATDQMVVEVRLTATQIVIDAENVPPRIGRSRPCPTAARFSLKDGSGQGMTAAWQVFFDAEETSEEVREAHRPFREAEEARLRRVVDRKEAFHEVTRVESSVIDAKDDIIAAYRELLPEGALISILDERIAELERAVRLHESLLGPG